MSDTPGVSAEQFKNNHLQRRMGELVSNYEDQLATMSLAYQALSQQYGTLQQQLEDTTVRMAELEQTILEMGGDKEDGADESPDVEHGGSEGPEEGSEQE